MKILNHKPSHKQFRCRLVAGILVFEEKIPVAGGANNYQEVSLMVVRTAWNDFYRREDELGGVEMNPTDFIHKNIVNVLIGEGYPKDVAQRGADKGVEHYRKCSQASKKGAMFDTVSTSHALRRVTRPRKTSGKPGLRVTQNHRRRNYCDRSRNKFSRFTR